MIPPHPRQPLLSASPFILALGILLIPHLRASEWQPIPLQSTITGPQPMTGIVLWDTSPERRSDAIQLEYSYLGYAELVSPEGKYDWTPVEEKLEAIASRGHQAILRFYFVYPGRPTQVPSFISQLPDYRGITAASEGKDTGFADWSHPALQQFLFDFHQQFAARYDQDPRLAFLQVGFGLWAEYHIYYGPFELGRTFPSIDYQAAYFRHMASLYRHTPWSVSVDAAKDTVTPFSNHPDLLKLPFGVFDDSFLCETHATVNQRDWDIVGRDRALKAPCGGEFSYYTTHDQQQALSPDGPHGESFESAASRFGISYMIGNNQPEYQNRERIRQAGAACGYRFRITRFVSRQGKSQVTITNVGVAPLYRDAYVAVNATRSTTSLKGLAPGTSLEMEIAAGSDTPQLTIECDHLVAGQRIGFLADLNTDQ